MTDSPSTDKHDIDIDITDIANYPSILSQSLREFIVRKGPIQIDINFPVTKNRSFSTHYYSKTLRNGEKILRDWLVYSQKYDAVHCFCCRLFRSNTDKHFAFANQGFYDWQHLADRIKSHEISELHTSNYRKWKELSKRIKNESTVDIKLMNQRQKEKERLRKVFDRLIAFIIFLARQNIAFTGSSNNARGNNDGNFQQLVHTVAKFDNVLKEHLEMKNRVHYLSPEIQNELIAIIATKVQDEIVEGIRESKYFSIILDTTPDVSRQEQMTTVFRYVYLNKEINAYEIRESFLGFIRITDKTGAGIAEVIIEKIEQLGLDFVNLRGQGYDNGSNMKGKNIGVQRQILEKNPRSSFVPCSNHSVNLVLNEAASSSVANSAFFSAIQNIYTFLSDSTNRWDILKKHLKSRDVTLKPLCTTRWSSRIDAMKPLRHSLKNIIAALEEISQTSTFKYEVRAEAEGIIRAINFQFVCGVCIWYDVLSQVNIASKALQSIKANIQSALTTLRSVKDFLYAYESYGFDKVYDEAVEIANEINVDVGFCRTQKRRLVSSTTETSFKDNFFLSLLEVAKNAMDERFEALESLNSNFSFLYDFENIDENIRNGQLKKSCQQLEHFLSHEELSDIDGNDLFNELQIVATLVNEHRINHVVDILNKILSLDMENLVPNAVIAYRIFLTIPVSVASGERSFSKLKIIKNYLRNSMNQDRLSGLAIISIENKIAEKINYDEVVNEFASQKVRKGVFD